MEGRVMVLLFIDGPLAQETKPWKDAPPTFQVALPKRITICECNPKEINEYEFGPDIFVYHRVLVGRNVAMYSKHESDEEILHSLKSWVVTDITKDWHFGCRDRRAWA